MRRFVSVSLRTRASVSFGLAALILIGANDSLQTASAEGDTRTISFHHVHTGEDITITYKRNGRYDEAALKKLDWFMRDWRKQQSTHMDPRLFDLLWETYREVGGQRPIEVICGYRSPGTNAMLRARSSGVAQSSQHMLGHAIDFEIPGVPLEKIRNVGLRLQRGGVGFYPTSGSPFVHMDIGSVRHWPRMTREQLVKVFPDGRTVHVPSDGKPLRGYALALADIEARGNEPNAVSLAAAHKAGIATGHAVAALEANQSAKSKSNFLAGLFGFGRKTQQADSADDENESTSTPQRSPAPVVLASLKPAPSSKAVAVTHFDAPLPRARPVAQPIAPIAAPTAAPMAQPVTMANVGNVFRDQGVWTTAIDSGALAPVPDLQAFAANTPAAGTAADIMTTASTGTTALSYADAQPAARPGRTRPMGAGVPHLPAADAVMSQRSSTAVAFTMPFKPALSGGMHQFGSPWLRAAMLTPSVSTYMTATSSAGPAMRSLAELMFKPSRSLAMTFSADPLQGMVAGRFTGSAVVFLATTSYTMQTTASLR